MALTRPDCLPARHTPAMVVPPQPQPVLPSVDARQLAAQQQDFINQQARILVRTGRAHGLPRGYQPAGRGEAGSHPAHHALSIRPSR